MPPAVTKLRPRFNWNPVVLPIEPVLPELLSTARSQPCVVLQAPPGAGKTTRVPLALLDCPWITGKVIVIQPRRLAVYSAAHRLAAQLGEVPGHTVGYRTRYDRCIGQPNRIEVMTDGLFLSMIQRDPELTGVSMVVFDEFHERSVNVDLGLAFALEAQSALREADNPLRLLVMSATLDGDRLSQWLGAPLVRSDGRSFPVETMYRPQPLDRYPDQHLHQVILEALRDKEGSLLVFLPGMNEIRGIQRRLEDSQLSDTITVLPLHASLPQDQQQRALQPAPPGTRKIVLSTNVAETSITIEDVRIVIDSGQARVARYDERKGMNSLHTEMISGASAEQRRGRAGRTQPGSCYRLWGESRQASLRPFNDPEILTSDLQPIALELALWGVAEVGSLTLLDAPPQDRLQRARSGLQQLGALNADGSITALGRKLGQLGLPPRLAALVWACHGSTAEADAIACAAILSEGDPVSRSGNQAQSDLYLRLDQLQRGGSDGPTKRLLRLCRQLQQRLQKHAAETPSQLSLAQALARAFPDRIAQQRPQQGANQPSNSFKRYLLSNGKGAQLSAQDKLSDHRYLVVLDATGTGTDMTIQLSCPITEEALRTALNEQLATESTQYWDADRQTVVMEEQTRLGALVLKKQTLPKPWPAAQRDAARQQLLKALTEADLAPLPWNEQSEHFCLRINWLHQRTPEQWPDFSVGALQQQLEVWLSPFLENACGFKDLTSLPLLDALKSHLGWERLAELDHAAPATWQLATGQHPLHYETSQPTLKVRLQECYGLRNHPTLPGGEAITLELLSPARRPIQITRDLPTFWSGSYREVAKEMRGRYPKHFWPDDPGTAQATTRTKNALGN